MSPALWRRSGGIAGLAALLETHAPQVEADLHRYYGIDLLDLWRPGSRLSPRKLRVLIEQLPPESATQTALRVAAGSEATGQDGAVDPADLPWSHTDMLVAELIDAITALHHTYVTAHSKQRPPRPTPVRRPGVSGSTPRGTSRQALTVADYELLCGHPPPDDLILGESDSP